MNITATEKALFFLRGYPDFHLPHTATECFGGISTLDGHNTTNLTGSIQHMDKILSKIKSELKDQVQLLSQKKCSLNPFDLSTQYIVENVHITLITSEETIKQIPVRNLFKYALTQNNEYSYESTDIPEYKDDTLLGVYMPKHGSIVLWIDKIIEKKEISEAEKKDEIKHPIDHPKRPELLFQKVLLHEMIHALMDVAPRIYYQHLNGMCSIISALGKKMTKTEKDDEETMDNVLVLDCYAHAQCLQADNNLKEDYNFVWNFIQSQPDEYKKACQEYESESDNWIKKLHDHLKKKVSNKEIDTDNSYYDYLVTAEDEETINDKEFEISWYNSIENQLRENLPSLESFNLPKENLQGSTFLLKNAPIEFMTPWIHCQLIEKDDYTVKLLVGNIIAYTFNLTGKERCIDLIRFKDIKEIETLGVVLSEKTAQFIADLILCVNPDSHYDVDDFISEYQDLDQNL